ncbi:mitochondrial carrier domain-containing protein [Chytridium lagenaria]|nr:mitochondrial carrier domain-containing protein [Chytridium lagenaria]
MSCQNRSGLSLRIARSGPTLNRSSVFLAFLHQTASSSWAPHFASKSDKKESVTARFLGSATSGVLELLGFHPVDTVAKRLMNSKTKFKMSSMLNFRRMLPQRNPLQIPLPLPRSGYAAGYKILQRIYKFGGQPFVNDYLNKNHKSTFQNIVGDAHAKTIMHATAGSLIGIGEIILLPLDALKIKMQVNSSSFQGKSALQVVSEEGWGLYRGATWTAARNAPGSFALFGGSAMVKEHMFALEDYSKATFFQNFCASIGGAVASIGISAPLDVIKTRIQAKSADKAEGGWSIVRNMVKNEGFSSFFKGLTPKILVVGPKLIFSFTVAQQMIPIFSDLLDKKN